MATARQAVGNILDAVVTTSSAVAVTISSIGKSASYAGNWMDAVLEQQAVKLAADSEHFNQTYVEQRAIELTQHRAAINKWVDDNPACAALYQASLDQIRSAVDRKTKTSARQ